MKNNQKRQYYKNEELLKKIGARIREIRLSMNISQATLANECELDYSQINRMELGKVNYNISILSRVANGLGVALTDLLE